MDNPGLLKVFILIRIVEDWQVSFASIRKTRCMHSSIPLFQHGIKLSERQAWIKHQFVQAAVKAIIFWSKRRNDTSPIFYYLSGVETRICLNSRGVLYRSFPSWRVLWATANRQSMELSFTSQLPRRNDYSIYGSVTYISSIAATILISNTKSSSKFRHFLFYFTRLSLWGNILEYIIWEPKVKYMDLVLLFMNLYRREISERCLRVFLNLFL